MHQLLGCLPGQLGFAAVFYDQMGHLAHGAGNVLGAKGGQAGGGGQLPGLVFHGGGDVTAVVNAGQPQLVDLSSLANVDSVTISGAGGTAHPGYWGTLPMFTLDDLSYTLGGLFPITVTPAANGTVTCTPNPVPEGDNATCTATPAAGFRLASFTGCAQVGTGNTCTLTNVTAPATVSATFAAAPVAVTTLHEWALMLLGLGAAGLGVRRLHRLT